MTSYADVVNHWLNYKGGSAQCSSRSLVQQDGTLWYKRQRVGITFPPSIRTPRKTNNGCRMTPIARLSEDRIYLMGEGAPWFWRVADFGCQLDRTSGEITSSILNERTHAYGYLVNMLTLTTTGGWQPHNRECEVPLPLVRCYRVEHGGNFNQSNHDAFDYMISYSTKKLLRAHKTSKKEFHLAMISLLIKEANQFAEIMNCDWSFKLSEPVRKVRFTMELDK
tara:strand:- start:560 stop:1228 length:669 start_codon:yes stop_codon:yes gene_type:complete